MTQTCAKDRANIITLYRKKISLSQISKILSIHKSTVSRVIRRFLERGTIQRKFWPPQSPDLNIIENLWHILKKNVIRRSPETLEQLWTFTEEEFYRIPNFYIKTLYASIPRRIQGILKNKGYPTKY